MSTTGPPPPLGIAKELSEGGLIAIAWVGVAIAGCFVLARTTIRLYTITNLQADDYWIYFAFTVLAVNALLTTLQAPHSYYVARGTAGLLPMDEKLLYHGNKYVRYEFASIGLFWTILWGVKASFLTLYWKLFEGLKAYGNWWWAVVIFTALTYVGCWIASALNCHPASLYFDFGKCNKPVDMRGGTISVAYSTAVDVLTDLMSMLENAVPFEDVVKGADSIAVMSLPLKLLYKLQITSKQKVGLASVFLIAIIIMIVAIIRASQIGGKLRTDAILLTVWSLIESTICTFSNTHLHLDTSPRLKVNADALRICVAVVVGCLPPFKSLFSRNAFTHTRSSRTSTYTRNRVSAVPLHSGEYSTHTKIKAKGLNDRWPSSDSTEGIITPRSDNLQMAPLQGDIRVQKDILVRSEFPDPTRLV
ncbi:hypothetical protein ACLMJK_003279 [Lecanora helva]